MIDYVSSDVKFCSASHGIAADHASMQIFLTYLVDGDVSISVVCVFSRAHHSKVGAVLADTSDARQRRIDPVESRHFTITIQSFH